MFRVHTTLRPFPTRRSSDLFITAGVSAGALVFLPRCFDCLGCSSSSAAFRVLLGQTRTGPDNTRKAAEEEEQDRKSTRLNSSHMSISYAVFCLKKKKS